MLDRVRIPTLRDAGDTLKEIALSVGVGKRSVRRIPKEPPIINPETAPTRRSRGIGRPSTVAVFQPDAERILKEDPSLLTVEVLSRLRGLGCPPPFLLRGAGDRHAEPPGSVHYRQATALDQLLQMRSSLTCTLAALYAYGTQDQLGQDSN